MEVTIKNYFSSFGLCLVLVSFLLSCNTQDASKIKGIAADSLKRPVFAKGFAWRKLKDCSVFYVMNPWEGARNTRFTYVLASGMEQLPDSLRPYPFIKLPVKRVVCLSTTQLAMIDALGETEKIAGISDPNYVYNERIRQKVRDGSVADVGYEQSLNFEKLLSLKPDLVLGYGIGSEVMGTYTRLKELGIPMVFDAEYLEPLPLGKTEWIRFVAAFFGCENRADSLFEAVKDNYLSMVSICKNPVSRPVVMTGLPWKDSWNIPPGGSTTARLIADAGGIYLWENKTGAANFNLSLEQVAIDAARADVWINPGTATSLNDIVRVDERLAELHPLKNKMVFNNNLHVRKSGGNDYWESGIMHPDLILQDLIRIFHPELVDTGKWNYFVQLK